nr:F-box/FBD/LRR-repeat protein At1g13570-like [Ipomoea trifida]
MTARKDIISELPDNVKDKILECLPTQDAARTALLSTQWKHVWLHHGRLVFDTHFLECLRKCEGDKSVGLVNVINQILLNRASPVKKFSLCISCPELEGPKPQQSDIDRWCLYLSRNGVEELNITIFGEQYKLPSCIILCRTIKQLKLGGFKFDIDCPIGGRDRRATVWEFHKTNVVGVGWDPKSISGILSSFDLIVNDDRN